MPDTQKSKLRIAFFGDDFSRRGRGTALVIQKIVEQLVEHHSDTVQVVLLRPAGPCRSPVCDRVEHVIIPRRYSTLLSFLWFFLTHRTRYDVVVFNRVVYPGFFLLRAKKRILILHDASMSERYVVPRTFVNRMFELFIRLGRPFIDIAVGDSENARVWISKYFRIPIRKTRSFYLAADDEYEHFTDAKRSLLLSELSSKYNVKSPFILDVSRFDPHKNIEGALDAFTRIKNSKNPQLKLVLVGGRHTADYSDLIEDKINASPFCDDIRILSYVESEDMPAIYNCAELLIYPSLVEGFGLPLIEAMKCGTPIVTSNISCLPEVAGGAALLVDPLDGQSIADAVQKILGNAELKKQLIARGLARSKEFSWYKTTETFLRMTH